MFFSASSVGAKRVVNVNLAQPSMKNRAALPQIRGFSVDPLPAARSGPEIPIVRRDAQTRGREGMERIAYRFPTVVPNIMRIFSQGSAYRPQATPAQVLRGVKSTPSSVNPKRRERACWNKLFPENRSRKMTKVLRTVPSNRNGMI